ncbi:unnamed protein product [Blepharisma stoltei]|uniref:Uncharacterized protein n=1 Tax=Blepharisma stoltei TaxID=1481888 RepID=A0AAU9J3X4_9CILI|nr:unnamed protein product [Blepharisma stoltei]
MGNGIRSWIENLGHQEFFCSTIAGVRSLISSIHFCSNISRKLNFAIFFMEVNRRQSSSRRATFRCEKYSKRNLKRRK